MTDSQPIAKQMLEAGIQQINLSYNTEQDRLLFRVGLSDNTELLVWLTQRITKMIWQLLNHETNLPSAASIRVDAPPAKAVEQFKQEVQATETLNKLDFATEYKPRPAVRNDGAMLAINAVTVAVAGKSPTLEMPCLEGVTVRMNLNQELIIAICNMLQLSCKEANWTLGGATPAPVSASINAPITIVVDDKKILH